ITLILVIGSNIVLFLPTFAQPTNTNNNQANTTDIDAAIINMLEKVSRGNIIDSTMNSIVSGMNASSNQDQIQNNKVEPKSLHDINSIISGMNVPSNQDQTQNNQIASKSSSEINSIIPSNNDPYSGINTASNNQLTTQHNPDAPKNVVDKFLLKVVNTDNNEETILKSNSLTEFKNELIEFCTSSTNLSPFECISSMQNSIQAVDFTSNYMGPSKLITDLDNYKLDLTVR
ncbi:MAG: hypothetical protein R3321_11520, partial [Nitrososphaeraceae archaeon]|nr:hypothetical protein [Nitrososphaeraceae archaeon]